MKKEQPESPFKPIGLTKKMVRTRPKGGPFVNTLTGEMVEVQGLTREVEVDFDPVPFIKLFSDALKILPRLSKPSLTLFCYMATLLKPGQTSVILVREYAVQHSPSLKGAGWYKAIAELEKMGVIKHRSDREYWMNPNVMFNGRRRP